MENNQEVEKQLFGQKVIWIILTGLMIFYGFIFFLVKVRSFTDQVNTGDFREIALLIIGLCFVGSIILFQFKDKIILRKDNSEKSILTKDLPAREQSFLRYYPNYFLLFIVLWVLVESGVISCFILSFASRNISYYLYGLGLGLFLNIFIFKPDYKKFVRGKNLE